MVDYEFDSAYEVVLRRLHRLCLAFNSIYVCASTLPQTKRVFNLVFIFRVQTSLNCVLFHITPTANLGLNNVTYRPIARQRLGEHIPAEAYSRSNRTSTTRQRIRKQDFSTIESLCFLLGPCLVVITWQRRSFEGVVENLVEFWRWHRRWLRRNGKKWNRLSKEDFMWDWYNYYVEIRCQGRTSEDWEP
jgi:hypothetical protein